MKKLDWFIVISELLIVFAIAAGVWANVYQTRCLRQAVEGIREQIPLGQ
jgi:hypothetical protein